MAGPTGPRIPFQPQYGGFTTSATASSGGQLSSVLSGILDPATIAAIQAQTAASAAGGSTAYKGPTTYVQTVTPSPTAVNKLLDAISADLLGRQLSQEEKNKYYAMIQAEEKKPGSATTTRNVPYGPGKTVSTTTGGLSEEQFLIEKIAGTDEAKANKVLDAYSAVNKLFGGLR